MTFDPTQGHIVLFGGEISPGKALQNTWAFDGGDWTQLEDIGPPPRHQHAAAYDINRSRLVVFGGGEGATGILGDTWEWDGTSWTQTEETGPPPRRGHSMAYDSLTRKIVLFGGLVAGGAAGALKSDNHTWEWDGTNWREVADTGPSPRAGAAIASSGGSVILHGGKSDKALGDTWQWADGSWAKLQEMGPTRRQAHGVIYDSVRQRIVLFGGELEPSNPQQQQPDYLGDTWEAPRPADGPGGPAGPTAKNLTVQPPLVSLSSGQPVNVEFDFDSRKVAIPYDLFMSDGNQAIGFDSSVIAAGTTHEKKLVTSSRIKIGVDFLGLHPPDNPPVAVRIATSFGDAQAILRITA
jgi:Galactose oxidase, central domain